MNSRAVIFVVSLLLITSLLCCSVSVFAVTDWEEIQTTLEESQELSNLEYTYIIWYVLQSWGIDVTIDEISGYNDAVATWMSSAIQDYLEQFPSLGTFNQWVFPWLVGFNSQGILQGNETFLEDVQDFADWLVVNFALVSDSTEIVQEGMHYVMDDDGNKWFAPPQGQLTQLNTPLAEFNHPPDYEYLEYSPVYSFYNGTCKIRMFNKSVYNERYHYWMYKLGYEISYDGGLTWSPAETGWGNNVNSVVLGFFYYTGNEHDDGVYLYSRTNVSANGNVTFQYNFSHLMQAPQSDASVVIVTNTIDIPDNPGTDIVIIDGEPQYIEVTFPDSINVSNYPSIISTGTISNPELDNLYGYAPNFFEAAEGGMSLFKQIIFQMPDEVLYCLYTMLGLGILFGMLRLMREH